MEGWDCLDDGSPSELTRRRWLRFAESGAKLIFGCEAAAVMPSGRANPRQMTVNENSIQCIGQLRDDMVRHHEALFGTAEDLFVGLQLTHSGRFCRPNKDWALAPKTAYAHPLLDKKFHCGPENVLSDLEIAGIIERYVLAAKRAAEAGFHFVDIKMAHGYLGHEFLTALDRPGPYGGSLENRTRFFREIVEGIKRDVPGLDVAVRLSLTDRLPFQPGEDRVGVPILPAGPYRHAFGADTDGLQTDLTETIQFIAMAVQLGIRMICTTAGSPYYNPHIQRPAAFAVSDGYLPPEDPLLGVFRQIDTVRRMKEVFPDLLWIGSGYSYLQEYLALTAEAVVHAGWVDSVGIGRMALCYPEICSDWLSKRELKRGKLCRTFGDCTNAPRAGQVSGCYPLDDFYRNRKRNATEF